MTASGLYAGIVSHRRRRPRVHSLRYRIFQLLLDLDELPGLDRTLRLFSRNRFNLISFHDKDHGDGSGALRAYVEQVLRDGEAAFDGGPIRLLCLPRVLGYVFNPISVYFCHHRSGDLAAVLYEVNNTFGQRHSYLFAVPAAAERELTHGCDKAFYVSPFMGMDMRYAFRVRPPGADLATTIQGFDAEGLLITAAFSGRRQEMTDAALWGAFVSHPLLTLKVVAGIHWEALKLLLKGVRLTRRPPTPKTGVTAAT